MALGGQKIRGGVGVSPGGEVVVVGGGGHGVVIKIRPIQQPVIEIDPSSSVCGGKILV